MRLTSFCVISFSTLFFSHHVAGKTAPKITLDDGVFTGVSIGSTNRFLGIPFARAPVGDLRFRRPEPNEPYNGAMNAETFGSTCILQNWSTTIPWSTMDPTAVEIFKNSPFSGNVSLPENEDCLFVNVWAPANATPESKLPVVFWIYGSGFTLGSSSLYDGLAVVNRSLEIGTPVIFVSHNHRLNSLGFLGGKEASEAGLLNLALHDQRLAMQWVQKYIPAFGGDPGKVTIWGESAGASAVQMHMFSNYRNPGSLFRAAFLHSVATFLDDGDAELGQPVFNQFATESGCGSELGSPAVFDCLRKIPIETIRKATDLTPNPVGYSSLNIGWRPYVDGVFLDRPPVQLLRDGLISNVPFVIGGADDEGTGFVFASTNVTTDAEVKTYLLSSALPALNETAIDRIMEFYPQDPAAGSPFDTGTENALTPQYKRIAALLGDVFFRAVGRLMLQERAGKQSAYSFLYKRFKSTPYLGSFHSSDDADIFGPGHDMADAVIRFTATLDPNGGLNTTWPRYTTESPRTLEFLDGDIPFKIINDTFREEAIAELISLFIDTSEIPAKSLKYSLPGQFPM